MGKYRLKTGSTKNAWPFLIFPNIMKTALSTVRELI